MSFSIFCWISCSEEILSAAKNSSTTTSLSSYCFWNRASFDVDSELMLFCWNIVIVQENYLALNLVATVLISPHFWIYLFCTSIVCLFYQFENLTLWNVNCILWNNWLVPNQLLELNLSSFVSHQDLLEKHEMIDLGGLEGHLCICTHFCSWAHSTSEN